jgi:hypothetical protein
LHLGKAREYPSDLRHRLIRKTVLRVHRSSFSISVNLRRNFSNSAT